MKKTKRSIGNCMFCGMDITPNDLFDNKDSQKTAVKIIVSGEEKLACLKHDGVKELVEKTIDEKIGEPT